ncbi:hypothetical protein TWF281_001338 [Arthrobotrys megalospora]
MADPTASGSAPTPVGSDYTPEEQAIIDDLFAPNHVKGIDELKILENTKLLEQNLLGYSDWADDLEEQLGELRSENTQLLKEVTDLKIQLKEEGKVSADELAKLRVELRRAQDIIVKMIGKYQPKPKVPRTKLGSA